MKPAIAPAFGVVTLSLLCAVSWSGVNMATLAAAVEDPHAYFNALVARSDHWKSYSLRSAAQLDYKKNGGYAAGNSGALWITYNPAADTDSRKQDAAKVVIPAFDNWGATLAVALAGSENEVYLNGFSTAYQQPRVLRVDGELMQVTGIDTVAKKLTVTRGAFSTAIAPHAANTIVYANTNSLQHQVRLPLYTEDAHSYLFTWDGYWTDSYLNSGLDGHKAFQFSSGRDSVWLEIRTLFSGGTGSASSFRPAGFNPATDVAAVDARSYNQYWSTHPSWNASWTNWLLTDGNQLGPGTTEAEALRPGTGQKFTVKPNVWTRFWVRIEQRANDYDYMDLWVADESTEPVQIYSRIALSVRSPSAERGTNQIDTFWLEYNTSTDRFVRGNQRDLVAYVRNFAVLRDTGNPTSLMLRPAAGTPPTMNRPAAPRNLRIVP